jgi:hypothetical protein
MPDDDSYTQFVMVRATPPPLTSGATLHWDGMSALSRRGVCTPAVEPVAPPAVPTREERPPPLVSRACDRLDHGGRTVDLLP